MNELAGMKENLPCFLGVFLGLNDYFYFGKLVYINRSWMAEKRQRWSLLLLFGLDFFFNAEFSNVYAMSFS